MTVEVVHQQVSELVPDKEENVRCALGLMVPDNPKVVHPKVVSELVLVQYQVQKCIILTNTNK